MTPTPDQLSKLPKWAQDQLKTLQRERDTAVEALKEWTDSQTETPISILEMPCLGERPGPSQIVRFIKPGIGTEFKWEGIHLQVTLNSGGRQHENGISLQWSAEARGLEHVAMIPKSFQQVDLIAKGNMR